MQSIKFSCRNFIGWFNMSKVKKKMIGRTRDCFPRSKTGRTNSSHFLTIFDTSSNFIKSCPHDFKFSDNMLVVEVYKIAQK